MSDFQVGIRVVLGVACIFMFMKLVNVVVTHGADDPCTITLYYSSGNVFNRYVGVTDVSIRTMRSSTKISFTDGKARRQLIVPSDWLVTKTKGESSNESR